METNLLLLDSYNKIEELLAYAFSFSNQLKRKLKIVYVFDFNWMVESYMVGPAGPVEPNLVVAERNAQEQFKAAEEKISEIADEYTKNHEVEIPYNIDVSSLNRIDAVQEEYESNPGMVLLIGNEQSYAEATGGLIGYPNLIEHVKCPVLVIPEDASKFEVNNVLYASDYHSEDIDALSHLFKLLRKDDMVTFTVLHNQKDAEFSEDLKWTGFKETVKEESGIKNISFELTKKDEIFEAIEEFGGQKKSDLIVILKEKKGFFKQLFKSSETKSVLTHLNKPVLVYHEK